MSHSEQESKVCCNSGSQGGEEKRSLADQFKDSLLVETLYGKGSDKIGHVERGIKKKKREKHIWFKAAKLTDSSLQRGVTDVSEKSLNPIQVYQKIA